MRCARCGKPEDAPVFMVEVCSFSPGAPPHCKDCCSHFKKALDEAYPVVYGPYPSTFFSQVEAEKVREQNDRKRMKCAMTDGPGGDSAARQPDEGPEGRLMNKPCCICQVETDSFLDFNLFIQDFGVTLSGDVCGSCMSRHTSTIELAVEILQSRANQRGVSLPCDRKTLETLCT